MNVTALQSLRVIPPALETGGTADELRRFFDREWDQRRAVELGEASAYGSSLSTRRPRGLMPAQRGESAPRCGDCGAIRPARGSCGSCGSSQPASLDYMNPRAAHMIGEMPYQG